MILCRRCSAALILLLLLGCGGDASAPGPAEAPPAAPTPASAPEPAAAAVTDPFGYYFLDEAAALPDWARGIDHLHLSTFDMKGDEMITVPLYGFIRMKEDAGGVDYKLVNPRIEGLHLTFTTQEIGGVSFAFEGDFQQPGEMPVVVPQGVALKGTLRRLEKGAPAGELNASFTYSAGD
jgi:hypothetical protein